MEERLANELLDRMNNTGRSLLRERKTCIRWLKQIKHLLTIVSKRRKSNWLEENIH